MSTFKLNLILPAIAVLCLFATSADAAKPADGTITTTGRVIFNDLEGGFYAIVGDNGGRYDPMNLPKEFQKADTRIKVTLRPRNDMMSFRQWGTIAEIVKIEKVEKADPPSDDEAKESPADKLRKTPTKIKIADVELSLDGTLIRNRMPMIGPRQGSNTYLILRLKPASGELPKDIKCKAVQGVDGEEIWESSKLEVRPSPKMINIVARNTPDWRKPVDVILTIVDAAGNEQQLRSPGIRVMEVH